MGIFQTQVQKKEREHISVMFWLGVFFLLMMFITHF